MVDWHAGHEAARYGGTVVTHLAEATAPTGAGWRALLTAYGRAQESRESAARFDDPFASMFIGAVTGAGTVDDGGFPRLGLAVDDDSSLLWKALRCYFCARTPFYDQYVLRAVEAGCRQVVLVAAGLDSRAFRLGLGEDVTLFELDQAAVLDFKQAVLDEHGALPTCKRVPLAVDRRDDWPRALSAAGFDASRPTAWLAEGLLMYLTRDDADQLLASITALSAPGSRLAAEYFSAKWREPDAALADKREKAAWESLLKPFRYAPAGRSPATWLSGHGWTPDQATTIIQLGSRQGREYVPPEFARPGAPQVLLFDGTYEPAHA